MRALMKSRLRHAGDGGGWAFSDLAIANFLQRFCGCEASARINEANAGVLGGAQAVQLSILAKRSRACTKPRPRPAQTHAGYLWIGSDDGRRASMACASSRLESRKESKTGPVSVPV